MRNEMLLLLRQLVQESIIQPMTVDKNGYKSYDRVIDADKFVEAITNELEKNKVEPRRKKLKDFDKLNEALVRIPNKHRA